MTIPERRIPKFRLAFNLTSLLQETGGQGPACCFCLKLQRIAGLEGVDLELMILCRKPTQDEGQMRHQLNASGLKNISTWLFVENPVDHLERLKIDFYLTDNENDVLEGRQRGLAIARLLGKSNKLPDSGRICFAFDYDQVLSASEAAKVLLTNEDVEEFNQYEEKRVNTPHGKGPLFQFLQWLYQVKSLIGKGSPECAVTIFIITWRNERSGPRMATTFQAWGIAPDEIFKLAGVKKALTLNKLQPDIFIDDSMMHIEGAAPTMLCAHIPQAV